jgi:2,4-dienoyl-CoA reductase-like NADH-dependent reductase (Old Yellow Enzyme family)
MYFYKVFIIFMIAGKQMLIYATGNVLVSDAYLGTPGDIAVFSNPSPAIREAWKNYASICQRNGTPALVQLNHPGRQSPVLTGNRGFFTKNVAPSPVKLDFGPGYIPHFAVSLVFGTPRELTTEEITGDGGIIDLYVSGAKLAYDSGFKGVQIHGA